MSFVVQKRRFSPDHKFFEEGNLVCRLYHETSKIFYPKPSDDSSCSTRSAINCQIHGCYQQFSDISSYEQHYASSHKNRCQECAKVLPTSHLLDLHINELHNPMFDILAVKTPMYQCLVAGCLEKFMNSKLRKKHLVEIHRYPSSFRFDRRKPSKNSSKQSCHRDNTMEVETESQFAAVTNYTAASRFNYSYKVPKDFSFGHGVQKSFMRSRPKSRGNHLIKQNPDSETYKDIETVDMKELSDVLDGS